jgi:hypothetical protein
MVRRRTVDLGYINVLASVELERRLSAVHLEMQTRVRVAELRQATKRQATSVQRDLTGIGLQHKNVIDVFAGRSERERGGHVAREFGNPTCWNTITVEGEIVVCGELGSGARDITAISDIEIATRRVY